MELLFNKRVLDQFIKKMAKETWVEVNPETSETHDFNAEPIIQGIYTNKKINVGDNKSNIYILTCEDKNIGVWGSAVLDSRFEQIKLGEEVKIEYMGKKKSEKGGREYKDFRVFHRGLPFTEVGAGEKEIPIIEENG